MGDDDDGEHDQRSDQTLEEWATSAAIHLAMMAPMRAMKPATKLRAAIGSTGGTPDSGSVKPVTMP